MMTSVARSLAPDELSLASCAAAVVESIMGMQHVGTINSSHNTGQQESRFISNTSHTRTQFTPLF
jgi:hypothetical protein